MASSSKFVCGIGPFSLDSLMTYGALPFLNHLMVTNAFPFLDSVTAYCALPFLGSSMVYGILPFLNSLMVNSVLLFQNPFMIKSPFPFWIPLTYCAFPGIIATWPILTKWLSTRNIRDVGNIKEYHTRKSLTILHCFS